MRGELRFGSTVAQEVGGKLASREDFVLEVEGEIIVGGAEAGNDIVFGGVDATFH